MNRNKGLAGVGLVLAIILGVIVVGGGAYYLGNSKGENKEVKIEENNLPVNQNQNYQPVNKPTVDNKVSEESSSETFTKQPAAIKSIKSDGVNKWILGVDLLSSNPKWVPGDNSKGGFFVNQNTKIRNLNITSSTKIYNCTTQYSSDYASGFENNVSSFVAYAESAMKNITGEFGYTAYFDISGSNITAIYEQCLP